MSGQGAVVILAGGEGSRIGGDKPLKLLGGERLIDRALRQSRQWSDAVAIAVRNPAQVPGCGAETIDDRADVDGPLGGLVAGLGFARSRGFEDLLTIPADMPFLPEDLLSRLARALGGHACALASSGGHIHPVCGLWRANALDQADAYIASGQRSLRRFAERLGCVTVDWPVESLDPFFNINSVEDLAEAERLLAD